MGLPVIGGLGVRVDLPICQSEKLWEGPTMLIELKPIDSIEFHANFNPSKLSSE